MADEASVAAMLKAHESELMQVSANLYELNERRKQLQAIIVTLRSVSTPQPTQQEQKPP